jgi:hypothetical protein
MREPLRIEVGDEQQAAALARELVGVVGLDVRERGGAWEVTVDCVRTDRLVVRVLEAVQRSLANHHTSFAVVRLDGREYRMHGA